MSEAQFDTINFSIEFRNYLTNYQMEKSKSGISLLDYFSKTGILPKSDETTTDKERNYIETMGASNHPIVLLISSLVFGIGIIVGLFLITVNFIDVDSDWGTILIIVGLLIGGSTLFFGIRAALTKVIIYRDKIILRKPFGRKKILWRDIVQVQIREKVQVQKTKTFWGTWKETGRKTTGVILDAYLKNGMLQSLDLEAYGLETGQALLARIFGYINQFNPHAHLPNMPPRPSVDNILNEAFFLIQQDPGRAFELGIDALKINEYNAAIWKLLSLLLVSIFPEESFPFFDIALGFLPEDADLWNSKGLAYEQLGDRKEASECFNKALEFNPNHPYAFNNLTRIKTV